MPIALIALSFAFQGCSNADNARTIQKASSISLETGNSVAGTYQTECHLTSTGVYAKTQLALAGSNFISQTISYDASDTTCSGTPTGQQTTTGKYALLNGSQINYQYSNGASFYDIYSASGNTVYFGDTAGEYRGETEDTRPTQVSAVPYRRI